MIHLPMIQGSDEWLRARMGKPTASEFERLITPAKRETKDGEIKGWLPTKGETRRAYAIYLLTELILDMPLAGVNTAAMEHGKAWEPKARAAYEMMHGVDVELCGFCTNDEGTIGASPDGFVGEDGSIEIKCPERPEIHCGYMVNPQSFVDEYFAQTQGQLFVTGRKWTDQISYFGGMPMVTVRVLPEPEFQKRLGEALRLFVNDLALYVDMAKGKGWIKDSVARAPRDYSKDFLSAEDEEMLVAALRQDQRCE